jgi:hypothetical protein
MNANNDRRDGKQDVRQAIATIPKCPDDSHISGDRRYRSNIHFYHGRGRREEQTTGNKTTDDQPTRW